MHLTQKIRIFPTKEQEEVLWGLSENCRLIYNFALKERLDAWRDKKESIGYTKQQNDLPQIKQEYPRYQSNYSKTLQGTLKKLDQDYKSFFALWKNGDKNARPPRFKGKKHFTTMIYNQSGFKLSNTLFGQNIELSHKYNSVPLKFDIPNKFKFKEIKEVQVFMDKGDYYVSIIHEIDEPEYKDNGLYQAIDLGVDKIVSAVNSAGKFLDITNLRPDKYWNPIINKLKSRRDHCKKGSNKWNKLNNLIKKCTTKMSNQIKDFQHKVSNKIVNNTKANTILVGDLSVKEMAQSKKLKNKKAQKSLNRATQNTGTLSRFVGFLTYKAQRIGKKVIEISEVDTTKMCCVCGTKHDMQLWNRNMICDCGNELDRDCNSAVNIMVRHLSQNALVDGLDTFVSNLRKTGLHLSSSVLAGSSCPRFIPFCLQKGLNLWQE